MTTLYLDPAMVPASLRGSYNGRKFQAVVGDTVEIPITAGLWDGGSRDLYSAIEFSTGRHVRLPGQSEAPWGNRQDQTVKLEPGIAIVRHTISSGHDMGLTFYVHPDNASKLLPAPTADLSAHECLVLTYTAHRKSSYQGKDRYQMAMDDARYGYGENRDKLVMSRGEWDAAKASLVGKGLLNKAGAITTAGRNANRR